ncbi:MAG TPA: hydroxylamine reductase [Syntrophomonadaceae bacterium]|nr:hydroxylamine reductase [Syntrophomonadaceae bacterium]
MFCNQCEQTSKGIACTVVGACGKSSEVAALQDLLLYVTKGLSMYAHEARKLNIVNDEVNHATAEALFMTLTNVNFDADRFEESIKKAVKLRTELKGILQNKGHNISIDDETANYVLASDMAGLIADGEQVGLIANRHPNEDIKSLQQIIVYGLRGVAAYAHHAEILSHEDDRIYAYMHEALTAVGTAELELDEWIALVLKCGEINLIAMEILDKANTDAYGHPVPTSVPLGHKKGKAILVSGHDLKDLKDLLEATQGTGINIYTHGEMLPAHGYPELKKYEHFYGNYGTAWHNQRREFVDFPGPILMTTNCIQKPRDSYMGTIFTTGPVGWNAVKHVPNGQFDEIIKTALEMPGFTEDLEGIKVMCGFAHNAVLNVADKIVAGVKAGDIKHFFLVGGCDGAKSSRNYYTEFVEQTPDDTIIMTLGCAKYRFYDKQLGDIGGIPRLLDVGQCNDAYSAVQIALALADAFECGVNELPLTFNLSWYEQKAVSILLSLFHLGINNIRLGPTLPAFITPNVLKVLVENFNIQPNTTVEEDLRVMLG